MSEQSGTNTPPDKMPMGGSDQGMRVLSYLLAGLLFYGGLGWLGDQMLHTSLLLPIGIIIGIALSIYLIIKRFGSPS